jgi:Ni/Fe-hydrogenase subunit HybB-like protein
MNLPNLLIFLGALLGSGLSVYLVHRYWPHEKRQEHTDVAGFIFAGVAVLYAVLLAFVVIVGWETLSSAHATTYTEADQLSNVYWIARSLPAPQGPAIEDLTLKYAHTVVNREWPLMNEGKSSPEAQNLLTQIRAEVFRFSPRTGQQQVLYEQAVVSVNGLTAARRDRLDAMTEEVPEPIWVALIFGAVIVIGFCLLFGVKSRTVHIGMVLAIAALITICLILIKDMQYPFAGNPHVGPEAFEVFLRAIPSSH